MNRSKRDLDDATAGKHSSQPGNLPPDPGESFVRPPSVNPSPTDHVFRAEQMVHFYDAPGEYGWIAEGKDHGLPEMSVIITDTHPGGGPPLHCHDTDEAQVLAEGRYRVLIGDRRFDVTGPATVRIPAGVPHTFVNPGGGPVHIVGVFPGDTISYRELGPNPLLEDPAAAPAEADVGLRARRTSGVAALGLLLALGAGACTDAGSPSSPIEPPTADFGHMQPTDPPAYADLAAAREATAHLQRFENAAPAGWNVQVTQCKENPPLGGMGYHFGDFERYFDGEADPLEPEILVYEPQPNGRLRLVALEYAVPFFAWGTGDPDVDDPPRLFGRDMKRVDDEGEWQLHVWLWKHNPAGIFEDWNPTVTCEHA